MPEKKIRQEPEKKLVEIPPDLLENVDLIASPAKLTDLVEDEAPPAASEAQSASQLELAGLSESKSAAPDIVSETPSITPTPTATAGVVTQQRTPINVLKSTVEKALPFVLVSVVVFCLPFLFSPGMSWLTYPQVRTYMLCALIWNLIGAVLYAQVDKRLSRLMIVLIFALPLITSHSWATWIYLIEMSLRSIFSIPP